MRILGNSFYFSGVLGLPAAPNWRFLSFPLLGRVSRASWELLAWVQECFEWVENFFLRLLWPETNSIGSAVLRPREIEETRIDVLTRSKGSKAASAIFEDLCKDPYGLYKRIKTANEDSFSSFYDLRLRLFKLCPCKKVDPSMRLSLEEAVIARMQELYPDKNAPITVVSVGAGGLYQELVYLAKLVNVGYENVTFFAIDTDPTQSQWGALSQLCTQVLNGKVNVEEPLYLSLESYQEAARDSVGLKPDLLLCIDLSDERFNVEGKSLPEHAFSFFQENGLLKETTLIAHSFHKTSSSGNRRNIVASAICVQNKLREKNLHALQQRKKEFAQEFEWNTQ